MSKILSTCIKMATLLSVLALANGAWANQNCGGHACPQKPMVGYHLTPD